MTLSLAYAFLTASILMEVVGTTALQASHQFTRPLPTLITIVCYSAAFYSLSHVLKVMPVGVAYAMWSGLGIVLISTVSYFVFNQKLDGYAILGIGLIIAGVLVINILSKSVTH